MKNENSTWFLVDHYFPPVYECMFGGSDYFRSEYILFTDGEDIYHGFVVVEVDAESERKEQWFVKGPDGHRVADVTHWTHLPPMPEKS